jgi:hypothetical protein
MEDTREKAFLGAGRPRAANGPAWHQFQAPERPRGSPVGRERPFRPLLYLDRGSRSSRQNTFVGALDKWGHTGIRRA